MRKLYITNVENIEVNHSHLKVTKDVLLHGENEMVVSDGFHTMDELYEHRITLFIALCRIFSREFSGVWRSKLHSDGSSFEGYFILGINKSKGDQITYHIPNDRWEETEFAETLDNAPEWDKHTSSDVINRLKNL